MDVQNMKLEFVSYDGKYPNLCRGTLIFKLGGKEYRWRHCLSSGGSAYFINDYHDAVVESGALGVDFPEDFPEILRPAVVDTINDNVHEGCCGGCL
jgi:hypothetical protein